MNVDINEIQRGLKCTGDNSDNLINAKNAFDQISSISMGNFTPFCEDYSSNINDYLAQISRISVKLKKLISDNTDYVFLADSLFRELLQLNGVEYDGTGTEFFFPGEFNRDKIIRLTYLLSNGTFGATEEEQKKYLKDHFGYGDDIYNLLKLNLKSQGKDKIESIYDVTLNVPVPIVSTTSDTGYYGIIGFDSSVPFRYNELLVDEIVKNDDFFNSDGTYNNPETGKNVLYVYNYMINNFHYTDTAARAILANMIIESYVKPDSINESSSAYGLCQWLGSRKSDLFKYASDHDLDVNSIDTQLEFMNHELSTKWDDERGLYARITGKKDADFTSLTKDFCAMYEIPYNDSNLDSDAGLKRAGYNTAKGVNNLIDKYNSFEDLFS